MGCGADGYEREGRTKVLAPRSNGHSHDNASLGVEYADTGTVDDTKTMAMRALKPSVYGKIPAPLLVNQLPFACVHRNDPTLLP